MSYDDNDDDINIEDLEKDPGRVPSDEEEEFFRDRVRASASDRRAPSHLWLISYSDFMTILMIFFLVMYGYTYMARASLSQSQKQVSYSDFAQMVYDMKDNLGSGLDVTEELERITIKLQDKILFTSGRAELNQAAKATLAELSNSLKLVQGDIVVQGHTDNVPIKSGPYRSNWELSTARSFSVIEELTQNGVDPSRLAAWGFGEFRPFKPNTSTENRRENRRIELVLIKKGAKGA